MNIHMKDSLIISGDILDNKLDISAVIKDSTRQNQSRHKHAGVIIVVSGKQKGKKKGGGKGIGGALGDMRKTTWGKRVLLYPLDERLHDLAKEGPIHFIYKIQLGGLAIKPCLTAQFKVLVRQIVPQDRVLLLYYSFG